MKGIFNKNFFNSLLGKQTKDVTKDIEKPSKPVELEKNEKTYDEGMRKYLSGLKTKASSPMGNPILDKYYATLDKDEKRLAKDKMINVSKPFSKRYMFDDDLGQRATYKNRLPNAETSGWTGLFTRGQMEDAGESIDAPDINTADIESTAIAGYRYNPKTGNLYIKFKGNDKEYLFPRVPKDAVKGFLRASSKGVYYNDNLKKYAVTPGEAIAIAKKYKGK